MSRIAKEPVVIPNGVTIDLSARDITAKGPKGELHMSIHPLVKVENENGSIKVTARNTSQYSRAMSGTMRSLVNNMVTGVSTGFRKELTLVGTGYRVQVNQSTAKFSLGYSHPIEYQAPDGVTFEIKSETSSQVEMVVHGHDKQVVGQVAADIRRMRPVEPYKGKGVRYSDEWVRRKQAKSVG